MCSKESWEAGSKEGESIYLQYLGHEGEVRGND